MDEYITQKTSKNKSPAKVEVKTKEPISNWQKIYKTKKKKENDQNDAGDDDDHRIGSAKQDDEIKVDYDN